MGYAPCLSTCVAAAKNIALYNNNDLITSFVKRIVHNPVAKLLFCYTDRSQSCG